MIENDLQQLTIPLPFDPQRNPMSIRAERFAQDWAIRFELLHSGQERKYQSLGYGRFAAFWCPNASFADLVLVIEWVTLFFIFDDFQDLAIKTNRMERYNDIRYSALQVIHNHGRCGSGHRPIVVALSDLCERTFAGQSSMWARRFELNLEVWLLGHARENTFRLVGIAPSPEEYLYLRRDASTVLPTVDLAELVEHTEIPDQLYFGRCYQEIVNTTADIMCLINDLHSLASENGPKADPINMVTVLRQHHRLDLDQAVSAIRELIGIKIENHRSAASEIESEMAALELRPATRKGVLRCMLDCQSAIAGMELWDRTGTTRFATTAFPYRTMDASATDP
jgi:hypothetical protein